MIFASLIFLYLFLPLNFILYFCVKSQAAKNAVLVAFSLVFYAWGEPVWVLLLVLTAFLDYHNAKIIERNRGTAKAKAALVATVVVDIGIFIAFKYSGFLVENLNLLLPVDLPVPAFALPIGISFYTFQTLTYVIDVYRGDAPAQQRYYKYLLYLSMYFQLVAGPIVRYGYVQNDIDGRRITPDKFAKGLEKFIAGLAKKVIVANTAGTFVNQYMGGNLDTLPALGAWFGIVMYTIQLYFDFSGYSDMAIGLGKMFGFSFPENFNYPYISKSIREFWQRWHITLGSFFRDYVYIPLGGNRRHVWRNLVVVWFLTGFWHGASWNFILWGLYNGALIMLERAIKPVFEKIPSFFRHLYLLFAVNIGFVFFYFTDLGRAGSFFKALFGFNGAGWTSIEVNLTLMNNIFWIILACIACTPILQWIKNILYRVEIHGVVPLVIADTLKFAVCGALLFCSTAMLAGNSFNPFLYFQF